MAKKHTFTAVINANQAVRVPSVICYKAGIEKGDLIDVEVVLVRKKEEKA